jgi:hypothetical protein
MSGLVEIQLAPSGQGWVRYPASTPFLQLYHLVVFQIFYEKIRVAKRIAKHIGSAHFSDFLWPKCTCGPHIELIACDCPHTHMRRIEPYFITLCILQIN